MNTRLATQVSLAAGIIVICGGTVVLTGWLTGIGVMTSFLPGWLAMKVNTAIGFLLSGLALVLFSAQVATPSRRLTGQVCAAAAALLGLLTFLQYMLGRDFGIDQWLIPEKPGAVQTVHLGRMAPATALAFVLAGVALLLPRTRFARTFQMLVHLTGLLGLISACHYFYLGRPLLPYTQMAIHTAGLFMVLACGLLAMRPESTLVTVMTGDTAGSRVSRRLLPAATFVPLVLGWFLIHGDRYGWYDFATGTLLFAVSLVGILGGLVWVYAVRLHRADLKRRAADARILAQLERLNLLEQVTRAIAEHQDPESIHQVVVRRLEESLPLDFCAILLREADGQAVWAAHFGLHEPELAETLQGLDLADPALNGAVAGRLMHESNLAATTDGSPLINRLRTAGMGSAVLAPLATEDKVFGFLVAVRRAPDSFSSGLCEFLTQTADHASLATHQARLRWQLQQAYDDLRHTRQSLLQQERLNALGQMASGIVHDINNAITPASLCAEIVLQTETGLGPKSSDPLQNIQKSMSNVAQTVARLRGFYRGNEPEERLAPVNLNAIIKEVVKLTRARWSDMPQQAGLVVELELDLSSDVPVLEGVEAEFRDAVTNLIFNATDAMPQGGRITVRTRLQPAGPQQVPPARVVLEVSDTGTGMDEQTRQHCLEPFFTTKGQGGTGMGLAMVYGMVQRHDGTLDIDSTPGRGSTFRIGLPPASGQRTDAAVPAVRPEPERDLRILLVDDDPLILRSLREVLSSDGHTVRACPGGREGLDALATMPGDEKFDVVITDLGMPQVDGRTVAAAAKAGGVRAVILLTGWGQRMDTGASPPLHVDLVLPKPPKLPDLRAALARLGG